MKTYKKTKKGGIIEESFLRSSWRKKLLEEGELKGGGKNKRLIPRKEGNGKEKRISFHQKKSKTL